ncbi:MAG: zinc ribbon domain-containing protein [Desulfotomaculaceae bacterium]|nr:zinc ribbon domain-containing protein [Desulfotomaculaceae bacterium]
MGANQDKLADTEVYKLAPGDIDHMFRRSGLTGNHLSPFTYNAEQAAGSRPSELFKALSESPKFRQITKQLLEPDLKIEYKSGGSGTADDQYYTLLASDGQSVLVQLINSQGEILLVLFPDWEKYLEWWTGLYASPGMSVYQAVFPDVMATEVLVCAVHCVDIYRRSYMESMLDYSGSLNLSLTTQDFVQLLKRSLSSKDKRWLLPAMFEVTPGLKNSRIALKPEHIKQVAELGFVTSKEAILTLGERSRIMGTEFITSWMGATGWQATALFVGEERSLSRVVLAPTAFANHLFSFETGPGGESRFRHQAGTIPELTQSLVQWMESLRKTAASGAVNVKTAEERAPRVKFCGHCGSKIRPGKKFCTSCGNAV